MSIPGLETLSDEASTEPAVETKQAEEIGDANANATAGSETRQSPTIEPTPAPPNGTTKMCGVCKEQEGRYKCSRCYLPYCSVTCAKQHNVNHPPDEPRRIPTPDTAPERKIENPRLGTTEAAGYKGPFSVLDDSKELRELFAQFPNLPKQLELINAATLRPEGGIEDFGGARKKEQWNQDTGWQKGVQALQAARRVYGKDGEGVREYGRLVLQLLNGEDEIDRAGVIRKELEDESTQIIRQLLELER